MLVAAGRKVTGPARSPAKAEIARQAGATPAVVDAFDKAAVRAAVLAAGPEAVVPPRVRSSVGGRKDTVEMHEVAGIGQRRQFVARPLIAAAEAGQGTRRFIAQSFCGWPLARTGARVEDGGSAAQFRAAA